MRSYNDFRGGSCSHVILCQTKVKAQFCTRKVVSGKTGKQVKKHNCSLARAYLCASADFGKSVTLACANAATIVADLVVLVIDDVGTTEGGVSETIKSGMLAWLLDTETLR